MITFLINEYITLKLEEKETVIYIKDEKFIHCKSIVLGKSIEELKYLFLENSIDDLASKAEKDYTSRKTEIPPETEFWAHCSNLQVWAENDYDMRLIHSNLAFSLLEKLSKVGDVRATIKLKEEIARKFNSGNTNVITSLVESELINILTKEELHSLLIPEEVCFIKDVEKQLASELIVLSPNFEPYKSGYWFEGKNITGIFLENSGLNELPNSIENLHKLKYLYLKNNNLKSLPNNISKVENLEIIDLTSNKLKEIPQNISKLTQLKELYLSFNELSSLPESLLKVKRLKKIALYDNRLKKSYDVVKSLKEKGVRVLL